jgi:hypothetical protein
LRLAYIDAGTGSMIVQAVVAGAAGIAAILKFRWGSIKARFSKEPDVDK